MNKGTKKSWSYVYIKSILIISLIVYCMKPLSVKVSAGPNNMVNNQNLMTPGLEVTAGYLPLKEKIKIQQRKEHVVTEDIKKKATGYLAMIAVNNGQDINQLTTEEREAIDYLALAKQGGPGVGLSISGIWIGDMAAKTNCVTTVLNEARSTSNAMNLASEIVKQENIIREQDRIINMNKAFLQKCVNPGNIKKLKTAIDEASKIKDGAIATKELLMREQKVLTDTVSRTQAKAETEIAQTSKASIYLNALIMLLDVKDLWFDMVYNDKDSMASYKNGNEDKINLERAMVAGDAAVAAFAIWGPTTYSATLTTIGGVAITASGPIGWGTALLVTGTVLLAHTVEGQKIFNNVADNIANSWYFDEFDEEDIKKLFGDKMIDHLYDDRYMKDLKDKLAKKHSGRTKPANGVGALKPNIYLYPEEQIDIVVSFEHPELLTTVIPDYSGNWSVEAAPDGTLQAEDGNEYSYLFYESETQPFFFGNKEGWLIKADERAERYTEILTEYGFNEKEIADFVEFWVDKLPEGVDYMMYPNDTEIIDRAMPVSFSTEPDSIFRIWFTFEAYDDQEVPEPEVEEFNRDGFTVVEWGGVILN